MHVQASYLQLELLVFSSYWAIAMFMLDEEFFVFIHYLGINRKTKTDNNIIFQVSDLSDMLMEWSWCA
jgi:hypothetical protein